LAAQEIWQLYQDGLGPKAFGPNPEDDDTEVNQYTILSWSPGGYALSHDVYFGTDYNDVNDANTTDLETFVGNQDSNSWDPCGLEYGSTYCWRIDEVSASGTAKGDVWSFATWGEPNLYLVGWWQFDEGDGNTAYDSAGDNDGNLVGDPCWVPGYIGTYALDFDDMNDYVQVPDDNSLDITGSITVVGWARAAAVPDSTESQGGWGKWDYYADKRSYLVRTDSSNAWHADICTQNGSFSVEGGLITLEWQHIAMTYDGSWTRLFIDGGEADAASVSGQILVTNQDVEIARYDDNSYFSGTIDDVRIYERALCAEEIQQLYQEGAD
jgi:hypothetical protein